MRFQLRFRIDYEDNPTWVIVVNKTHPIFKYWNKYIARWTKHFAIVDSTWYILLNGTSYHKVRD